MLAPPHTLQNAESTELNAPAMVMGVTLHQMVDCQNDDVPRI
jgi:hypothetical protein